MDVSEAEVHSRTEPHSYPSRLSPRIELEEYDEGSTLHADTCPYCSSLVASHRQHIVRSDVPMLELLQLPRSNPVATLPSNDFFWVQGDTDFLLLFYKDKFTGMAIREVDGTYLIDLGDWSMTTVPTLRQAQTICHKVAWTFRDSLPIGIRGRQHEATGTGLVADFMPEIVERPKTEHDFSTADEWVRENLESLKRHAGKWVAVSEKGIVGVSTDFDEVFHQAKEKGIINPLVFKVPQPTRPKKTVTVRRSGNSPQTDRIIHSSSKCLCLEGTAFCGEHPSQHDVGVSHKLHIAHLDVPKPSRQLLQGIRCPQGLDSLYWVSASGCTPYVLYQISGKDTGVHVYRNHYVLQRKLPYSLQIAGKSIGDYDSLWKAVGEAERRFCEALDGGL